MMDDLIWRTDVVNYIEGYGIIDGYEDTQNCIRGIKALPSAQPKRKTGRWIYGEHDVAMCDGYHCSECGFFVPWDYKRKFIDFIKDYNFCPNCGNTMSKEGE